MKPKKYRRISRRISRTFRGAHDYNMCVSGTPAFKRPHLHITTRRGRSLLRMSKHYLYFHIPPGEARRMLATLKELLE